jgi:hypothetical protein
MAAGRLEFFQVLFAHACGSDDMHGAGLRGEGGEF